jgi:hypothetical protein
VSTGRWFVARAGRIAAVGFLLLVLASALAAAEHGLIACYRFDEGSGDVLRDRSGNANTVRSTAPSGSVAEPASRCGSTAWTTMSTAATVHR